MKKNKKRNPVESRLAPEKVKRGFRTYVAVIMVAFIMAFARYAAACARKCIRIIVSSTQIRKKIVCISITKRYLAVTASFLRTGISTVYSISFCSLAL